MTKNKHLETVRQTEKKNPKDTAFALWMFAEKGLSIDSAWNKPESGYMVSERASERIIESMNCFSLAEAEGWVSQNDLIPNCGSFYGVWVDSESGKVYLDISVNYDSLDVALQVAKEENQLAIWDVKNQKEIRVK